MASFRIGVTPHRRAAARFVAKVRRELQKAFADRPDISQTMIADVLGVHRSVVNRQLKGTADISLGRVAEFAQILGVDPEFRLVKNEATQGVNAPIVPVVSITQAPTFRSVAVSSATGNVDLKQGIYHVPSSSLQSELVE